jgi:hypothetical protein
MAETAGLEPAPYSLTVSDTTFMLHLKTYFTGIAASGRVTGVCVGANAAVSAAHFAEMSATVASC